MTASKSHYINGEWIQGKGAAFSSSNPANSETLWQGNQATEEEVIQAVKAARSAFPIWSKLNIQERIKYLLTYKDLLTKKQHELAEIISQEVGKPLWESLTEITSMINKIDISIQAYDTRCPETSKEQPTGKLNVRHRPHGVLAVFGPFNFPGHLPHGQIIPALLAGNTIIFKPSEQTPLFAEKMVHLWEEVKLPPGVLNLIQGARETGQFLSKQDDIDGILFTGSWPTGKRLAEQLAATPYKILALEMGGNNPLVVGDVSDLKSAAYITIQSAFLTSGQRCSCARRLIIPQGKKGDQFLNTLISMTSKIRVGSYNETPTPFMGPVISAQSAANILNKQQSLIAAGAKPLLLVKLLAKGPAFLSPGILDVTDVKNREDEEIFGPLLQVIRVPNFAAAIEEGNNTAYGLTAGLLSDNHAEYTAFYNKITSGVINWNVPITGVSGAAPFGGLGQSGNNRPSAFYAADFCAYPVTSVESPNLKMPNTISPGIEI